MFVCESKKLEAKSKFMIANFMNNSLLKIERE